MIQAIQVLRFHLLELEKVNLTTSYYLYVKWVFLKSRFHHLYKSYYSVKCIAIILINCVLRLLYF